tara:strand:- start:177 stop:635 length:459 start_codon:yes stop_codon:yes gene_type:complete
MIEAEVLVESKNWKKIIRNPKRQISDILKKFPNNYKFFYKKVYISVLLTNNKKIKILNHKFRKKNKATDILSFPSFTKNKLNKNLNNKKIYLGDIAISYEEFSKKNKKDITNGFTKIFIHGFLHLLNHDHKSYKDFEIMNSIEKKIFQKVKG